MKNTFKFFSLMMVAGALLFASCTKEPEKPVTPKYTINVTANDNTMGAVTGGGVYDSASTITITATPNEGYVFVNWNDGNTQNPRTLTVTANANFMANFEEASGVKVTFGTETWKATTILGKDYSSMGYLELGAYKDYDRDDTPSINGYTGVNPGNYTHNQGDYYYFFYFEFDDQYYVDTEGRFGEAGKEYPVWQPGTGTFHTNITAIDLNARTITATAEGNPFNIESLAQTGTQDDTRNLSIVFKNASWESADSKGLMPKNHAMALVK